MDYGISNRDGRPSEAEVAAILARAVETGVGYLETAASYADAELLIGRHLPLRHQLRIITKLPSVAEDLIAVRHTKTMLAALAASLDRLRTGQIYGLLIHHARDLAKPGWQYLIDALHEARACGLTSCIGVSIYDDSDLALIEGRFTPDIVQLPFNALDRRLSPSGWLTRLRASGIQVHARSLFLQGLLLMDPATVPEFFAPVRKPLPSCTRHGLRRSERRCPAVCATFSTTATLMRLLSALIVSTTQRDRSGRCANKRRRRRNSVADRNRSNLSRSAPLAHNSSVNTEMPRALFRCDASPAVGAGHVTRCLAFAEFLAETGWHVAFAVGAGTAATVPAIVAGGFSVHEFGRLRR